MSNPTPSSSTPLDGLWDTPEQDALCQRVWDMIAAMDADPVLSKFPDIRSRKQKELVQQYVEQRYNSKYVIPQSQETTVMKQPSNEDQKLNYYENQLDNNVNISNHSLETSKKRKRTNDLSSSNFIDSQSNIYNNNNNNNNTDYQNNDNL